MTKGWILVHRQIQDCSIWTDTEPFDRRSAWIDLLLLVNHGDKEIIFNGHPLIVKRGQYLTSIRKLAERWNWSRDRVSRYLKLLEELRMITRNSDSTRTLVTIEKYEFYQDAWDSGEDSYKDSIKSTPKSTTKDSDKAQTKNVKNEKECKRKYGTHLNVELTDAEFEKLADEFGVKNRDEAIQFLDDYMADKPDYKRKHKDHNRCLRMWVFRAVAEQREKNDRYKQNYNSTYAGGIDCNEE